MLQSGHSTICLSLSTFTGGGFSSTTTIGSTGFSSIIAGSSITASTGFFVILIFGLALALALALGLGISSLISSLCFSSLIYYCMGSPLLIIYIIYSLASSSVICLTIYMLFGKNNSKNELDN